MRLIGHIDTDVKARTFGDYLYVQGIENEMEREPNGTYAVWIVEEDRIEQAKKLLENFVLNPGNPEYKQKGSAAEEKRIEAEKADKQARQRVVTARQIFPQSRAYGVGPFTFVLILACVVVALYSKMGSNVEPILSLFISETLRGSEWLPEVRHGEVWRLFTPMLVHFGPVHILFNMMWLFQLGSLIEDRKGTLGLIIMVLVIAGGSNLLQYFTSGPGFGGMSGVVYGLFGYIWIRGKFEPASGYYIDRQSVIMMIVWLFLCASGVVGRVANGAHFGGLIIGAVWGYIDAMIGRSRR